MDCFRSWDFVSSIMIQNIGGFCRAFCEPDEFSMKSSGKNGYVSLSEFYQLITGTDFRAWFVRRFHQQI